MLTMQVSQSQGFFLAPRDQFKSLLSAALKDISVRDPMGVAVMESGMRTASYFWEEFAGSFQNQNSGIYLNNIHVENIMIQINI